jgi:transcriptional regulator with XRE-family HTH domain
MASYHLITAAQCRAARGLLGWTQQDLATATGLSKTAIVQFETGLARTREETLAQIVLSLTNQGIEFVIPDGVNRRATISHLFADEHALQECWPMFLKSLNPQDMAQLTIKLVNWPEFQTEYTALTDQTPVIELLPMAHYKAALIGNWLIMPLLDSDYRVAIYMAIQTSQWIDDTLVGTSNLSN